MALQGNLVDLPLIDLVQVLTLQNKTGVLTLSRNFSQAQVAFTKSRIYSAFVHHTNQNGLSVYKQGEEALYDLLDWPDGQFTFELTNALPAVENVQVKWDHMILEYCRLSDEKDQKHHQNEIILTRPKLVPDPPYQAEIKLDLEQWRLLFQINGELTLKEIADNTRQDYRVIVSLAENLEKLGLITLERMAQPKTKSANSRTYYQPSQEINNASANSLHSPNMARAFGKEPANRPYSKPPVLTAPSSDRTIPGHFAQPASISHFQPVSPQNNDAVAAPKPKVQRGVLSGIMAKIRGL